NSIAAGCGLGAVASSCFHRPIRVDRDTSPVFRSNSTIAELFHKLTHALVPALLAITVYGYSAGMYRLASNFLRRRAKDFSILPEMTSSSTTLSERLLAISRRSPRAPGSTANPAG